MRLGEYGNAAAWQRREAENARFLGSFQKSIDLAHEAKKNSSVQPSSFLSIQEMGEEVMAWNQQ